MTFNIQFFAAAAGHTLHIGRAWAHMKLAERARSAQHHDPIFHAPRAPLLSMLTSMR